jgi:hypothetical protein
MYTVYIHVCMSVYIHVCMYTDITRTRTYGRDKEHTQNREAPGVKQRMRAAGTM